MPARPARLEAGFPDCGVPRAEQASDRRGRGVRAIGAPPRLASPEYLDAVGAATRRLELALGAAGGSPFAEAMKRSTVAVDALTQEVETAYKVPLE